MPRVLFDHVVSFSSEDPAHPASNLVSGAGRWVCEPDATSCSVVLALAHSTRLFSLQVGALGAALVEVLVGRSETPDQFQVLVASSVFLSPAESRRAAAEVVGAGASGERVRGFSHNQMCSTVRDQAWDRLRVVCSQPYVRRPKVGLAFVHVFEEEPLPPPVRVSPPSPPVETSPYCPGDLFRSYRSPATPSNTYAQIRRADADIMKGSALQHEDKKRKRDKVDGPTDDRSDRHSKDEACDDVHSATGSGEGRGEKRKRDRVDGPTDDRSDRHSKDEACDDVHSATGSGEGRGEKRKRDRVDGPTDDRSDRHSKDEACDDVHSATGSGEGRGEKRKRDRVDGPTDDRSDRHSKDEACDDVHSATGSGEGRGEKRKRDRVDRPTDDRSDRRSKDKDCDDVRYAKGSEDGRGEKRKLRVKDKVSKTDRQNKPRTTKLEEVLRGVVFGMSGYENPQRGELRAAGVQMGGVYCPRGGATCTHLICAFPNTPKLRALRQEEKKRGVSPTAGVAAVSGEWLVRCRAASRLLPCSWFAVEPALRTAEQPLSGDDDGNQSEKDTDDEIEDVLRSRVGGGDTDEEGPPPARRSPARLLPDLFQGRGVHISKDVTAAGYDATLLARYVRAYGGRVALSEDEEGVCVTLRAERGEGGVRPDWLWACHKRGALLPMEPYILDSY